MRDRQTLTADVGAPLEEPAAGRRLQFVVRAPGRTAPLEALLVDPAEGPRAAGGPVLLYFLGFNVPLGPWEGTKAQLLANAFRMPVLAVELPGQSRFGDPLPRSVAASMRRGGIQDWAGLQAEYVRAAVTAAGLVPTGLHLVGYSTGCSLAMSSLAGLRALAPIRSVTLIEPVGALSRGLARLAVDNARDVLRQPPSYATNHGHRWVMALRRRQLREPWVRYWPQDLLAITQVLCRDHIVHHVGELEGARLTIVRGERSDLCTAAGVAALEEAAEAAAAEGRTITVTGLGHPLWHSFPVVVPLAGLLAASSGAAAP